MSTTPPDPHASAKLGVSAFLLGLVGSAIAYLGLWIESDVTGLIGWSLVGLALLGGVTSVLWNIAASLRNLSNLRKDR